MPHKCRETVAVDALAPILLAASLLLLPLPWLAAAILAGLIHELFHWLAVRLCGGKISRIRIGPGGALMTAEPLTPGKQMICSLAGPASGLCLLFLGRWMPRTALCAVVQSVYNLLPILPLDGGRALETLANSLFPEKAADRICYVFAISTFIVLALGALCAAIFWSLGITGFIPAALVAAHIRRNYRKTPCIARRFTIQ